ncbi:MAG: ABC transporter substrate-binding protein [Deltaproteobacteria bacterium]|nr:ABC transporter substrate-binding protein [Deltaproteobacteria bacterium]
MKLGFSGASSSQLAGYVAMDQKLFTRYGLEVELAQSSGTTMIQALGSGILDVALVGGGQAISGYLKGVEVRILSGLINYIPYQLWVRPEISEVKDLKGKKFATSTPGTSPDMSTRILLERLRLDPLKDVTLVRFGRLQLLAPALVSGVVDAALLSPPYSIEAQKSGLRMLIDLAPMRIPYPFTSVVSSHAVLLKSAPLLEGFLKGILHGIRLSYSRPEIAKKALGHYLRVSDTEVIEETYKRVLEVTERIPLLQAEAIHTFTRISGESGTRSALGILEMKILRQIEGAGFVNHLYSEK